MQHYEWRLAARKHLKWEGITVPTLWSPAVPMEFWIMLPLDGDIANKCPRKKMDAMERNKSNSRYCCYYSSWIKSSLNLSPSASTFFSSLSLPVRFPGVRCGSGSVWSKGAGSHLQSLWRKIMETGTFGRHLHRWTLGCSTYNSEVWRQKKKRKWVCVIQQHYPYYVFRLALK